LGSEIYIHGFICKLHRLKEGIMNKQVLNYETLLNITKAITSTRDPEDVVMLAVEGIKHALDVKGCALFIFDRKAEELKLAAAFGLSDEYLNKGPVSALRSIAQSLKEGPVAIYDASDDPRLQYPEEAKKEGIASILSVPIQLQDRLLGALRVYTAEPWEFTLEDVNFVQAVAQITGMAFDMCRVNKGLKSSIEILKTMRDPRELKSRRRTPYEGVPKSVSPPT
jgi:signal transduction protein with GAF and PtsI domain